MLHWHAPGALGRPELQAHTSVYTDTNLGNVVQRALFCFHLFVCQEQAERVKTHTEPVVRDFQLPDFPPKFTLYVERTDRSRPHGCSRMSSPRKWAARQTYSHSSRKSLLSALLESFLFALFDCKHMQNSTLDPYSISTWRCLSCLDLSSCGFAHLVRTVQLLSDSSTALLKTLQKCTL